MINLEDPLAAFVIALLDDDNGISEQAFEKLMAMLGKQGEADLWAWLDRHVDCGEKFDETRYFLPSKVIKSLEVA